MGYSFLPRLALGRVLFLSQFNPRSIGKRAGDQKKKIKKQRFVQGMARGSRETRTWDLRDLDLFDVTQLALFLDPQTPFDLEKKGGGGEQKQRTPKILLLLRII